MKVLIVGGVAGGATAAARIRRLDESAEIIMFERTNYVSYANCGLPYFIGDVIQDEKNLTLQTPSSFKERFNVDVRVNQEVLSIDRKNKKIQIRLLKDDSVYEESYDKLILSPGAKPIRPPFPGIDSEGIFSLRTVEDTFKIKNYLNGKDVKSVLVVGGGYIGIEMAENLKELGLDVTIIQKIDQLMTTIDYDIASFVEAKLRCNGINIELNSNVVSFSKSKQIETNLEDGRIFRSDIVILAIGVVPDGELAINCGLETGLKGSIKVNDMMQTNDNDIYAVGDAVEVKHLINNKEAIISLAGPANKQARIAADNICGFESHYKGSMGTSIIKIFDLTLGSVGLTERMAENYKYDIESIILSPSNHATYYPGATILTIKIIFEKKTLKILGAQVVGNNGVDKKIDVLATAISCNMKANELKDLELAYAPPYSSAKDPINIAGFIVDNIDKGIMKQFYYKDINKLLLSKDATLIDTRTEIEYSAGHIPGFINIPLDKLRSTTINIDKSKPVYVICQSGLRSYIACRILTGLGFDAFNFSGGYRYYAVMHSKDMFNVKATACGKEI